MNTCGRVDLRGSGSKELLLKTHDLASAVSLCESISVSTLSSATIIEPYLRPTALPEARDEVTPSIICGIRHCSEIEVRAAGGAPEVLVCARA
jgi:hypothetical protein